MLVIVPHEVQVKDTAMLWITGGRNLEVDKEVPGINLYICFYGSYSKGIHYLFVAKEKNMLLWP